MNNSVDRVTIVDVVMVDDWVRIKEKYDKINIINEQQKSLLCLVVTSLTTCFFVAATLKQFGGYIQEEIVYFLIWWIYIWIFAGFSWIVLGDYVANAIDTFVVRSGRPPLFSKFGDLGVNLSYMINKYTTDISYSENKVEIIFNKTNGNVKKQEKLYLANWLCEYKNIKNPTLDLENMRVILPYDYQKNENIQKGD